MEFKTVNEAFNFYRNKSVEEIEKRAQEIKGMIETDPNVDIKALNIELSGLSEARSNAEEKTQEARSFNPITGGNFQGGSDEAVNGDVYASKEYRNAFFKSLMGRELNGAEKRAMERAIEIEKRNDDYTTSGNTAVIIPTTTLNEIISKARKEGGALSLCRAFNMPSKIAIPVATPSGKASWNTEGTPVDSEKPSIASVSFDPLEIIKVFSISAKVKAMSVDAFEAYLVEELKACVLECIADAVINGRGHTTYNEGMGVLNGVTWVTSGSGQNAIEVAHGSEIDFDDVVGTVALLKRGYNQGAKWVMNNSTLYKSFYSMTDDNGRPIFVEDPKNDNVGKILGHEVVVDDFVPDDVVLYGNFAYMGYNLANGIAVEASTHSSFKSGRVDYRGMAIADTQVIVPEAFVKLYIAES